MRFLNSMAALLALTGVFSHTSASEQHFDPPVQLTSADQPMGMGILYPSPLLKDVTGDGVDDLVIGDLIGRLQFATRLKGGDTTAWSELQPLMDAAGKPLKFDNW